jgi:hypothetical protein
MKKNFIYAVLFIVLQAATVLTAAAQGDAVPRDKAHGILANYFRAPISFEPNQGQAAVPVKFVARGAGYNLYLTPNRAVFSFPSLGAEPGNQALVLTLSMVGANPAPKISGGDELQGKSSYFFGSDPKTWRTDIPNFGKVQYENIYPGVDLIFHGIQGQLEYDFFLHPGAQPKVIAISFQGAKGIDLNHTGELVLEAGKGRVFFHKPVAYQLDGEQRQSVPAHYRMIGKNQVGFVIGSYDSSKPLIIDPALADPDDNQSLTQEKVATVPAPVPLGPPPGEAGRTAHQDSSAKDSK